MRLSAGSLVPKEGVYRIDEEQRKGICVSKQEASFKDASSMGTCASGSIKTRHLPEQCLVLPRNPAAQNSLGIFLCKFSLEAHKKNLFLSFFFFLWILFRIKGTKLGETYVLIPINLLIGWVSLDNHISSVFLNFLIDNERSMIITCFPSLIAREITMLQW